jgi:hypothetical protein
MKQIISRHKSFWSQKTFSQSAVFSLLLLIVSLVANYFANVYTTTHASNYVSDMILDNLPVVNLDFIFIQGAMVVIVFGIFLLLREPEKIPFVVKSVAVFVLIRSAFIMMTHTALPIEHILLDPNSTFRYITEGNDMFFSSHAGLPFLMALIFWENKKLRITFFILSGIFALTVLMAHLHYSIDVFAAFFITYSIFHICQRLFPQDYKLSQES